MFLTSHQAAIFGGELRAFHGNSAIKAEHVARARSQRLAGNVSQGDCNCCAITTTIGSYMHSLYPERLGLPEELACLDEGVFEVLPKHLAPEWPEQFLEAIPVGARTSEAPIRIKDGLVMDYQADLRQLARGEPTIEDTVDMAIDLHTRRFMGAGEEDAEGWNALAHRLGKYHRNSSIEQIRVQDMLKGTSTPNSAITQAMLERFFPLNVVDFRAKVLETLRACPVIPGSETVPEAYVSAIAVSAAQRELELA